MHTALASSPLPSSRDYRALVVETDRIFLANQQQFVQALLPHQHTSAPLPPPKDDPDTAAAVTARRQCEDVWCYYHSRFGAKAKQCCQPCSFGAQGKARAGAH